MEQSFQVLDCDYVIVDKLPIVRLFGKTQDGKTVCAFVENFLPYFYLLPEEDKDEEVTEFLKNKFDKLLHSVEKTEKYLPFGFQKDKTKLLKITLTDPSQTPLVREELKRQKFTKEIYEADILFKYRFMVDSNISGMRWVNVEGTSASTSIVGTNKKIKVSSIRSSNEDFNADLKYLGIDIEVVPGKEGIPNPTKDPIAIVSLSFFPAYNGHNTLVLVAKSIRTKEKDVLLFKNETSMLEEFVNVLSAFDPDIITGYNINGFDLPYILERLKATKISRAIGRCNQKQAMSKKFGMRTRNTITGRIVADVYDLIKESVGKGLLRLKRYGLGDVSKELINEQKVDVSHSEIGKYWNGNEEQNAKLIEYARKDAQLVLKLLLDRGMLDKFIELSKVSGVLMQDVLDGGEATRVENVLLREFNKQDYVVPCKPDQDVIYKRMEEREAKGFKGALVLEPQVGLHTDYIVYLDFRSMYPSIFIAYNICPTTLVLSEEGESLKTCYGSSFVLPKVREGIMPKIVKHLIEERDKVRAHARQASSEEERRILNAKQVALKYVTNSFYGYTGYVRARLYVLDIANTITSCGRELIQKTKSIVEEDNQFKVIYGDTDSIMVKTKASDIDEVFKIGSELESKINSAHKGIIQMKIEGVYKTLLVLTKKRYAGLSIEKVNGEYREKIVMKGIETVRRDWCDLVSKTLYDVLEIILKEQNPKKAFVYTKEVLGKLERNEIPVEDLVITKSISKSLKEYKGIQPHIELLRKLKKRSPRTAPGVGDRIGFVITKGLQLMSERAEDPEYVKENKLKIDSKYYIESQIVPPLERVFEAIGFNKSELMGVGRQMLLADAVRNGSKKQVKDEPLKDIEGFICNRCSKTYRRIPLIGKCDKCDGELVFYLGEAKSRYYAP